MATQSIVNAMSALWCMRSWQEAPRSRRTPSSRFCHGRCALDATKIGVEWGYVALLTRGVRANRDKGARAAQRTVTCRASWMVYAATVGVRVLSLSDGTLRKPIAEEPTVASKLLLNISRMLCWRLIKANSTVGA